jgi:hypothetical protein
VVVAFLPAEGEDPPLWKNELDDGEREDLEDHEACTPLHFPPIHLFHSTSRFADIQPRKVKQNNSTSKKIIPAFANHHYLLCQLCSKGLLDQVEQAFLNERLGLRMPRGGLFAVSGDTGDEEVSPAEAESYYVEAAALEARSSLGAKEAASLEAAGYALYGSAVFAACPALAKLVGRRTRRFFRLLGLPTDGQVTEST